MTIPKQAQPFNYNGALIAVTTMRILEHVELMSEGAGIYPGARFDDHPKRINRLYGLGLVDEFIPHNMAHKNRAVINEAGREALKQWKQQ